MTCLACRGQPARTFLRSTTRSWNRCWPGTACRPVRARSCGRWPMPWRRSGPTPLATSWLAWPPLGPVPPPGRRAGRGEAVTSLALGRAGVPAWRQGRLGRCRRGHGLWRCGCCCLRGRAAQLVAAVCASHDRGAGTRSIPRSPRRDGCGQVGGDRPSSRHPAYQAHSAGPLARHGSPHHTGLPFHAGPPPGRPFVHLVRPPIVPAAGRWPPLPRNPLHWPVRTEQIGPDASVSNAGSMRGVS